MRTRPRSIRKPVVGLLAAFAVLAAGCGSDDAASDEHGCSCREHRGRRRYRCSRDDRCRRDHRRRRDHRCTRRQRTQSVPGRDRRPQREQRPGVHPEHGRRARPSSANRVTSSVDITDGTFVVEDAAAAIRGYAEDGFDLVIAHGSQYGGPLAEIAPDFPDVVVRLGDRRRHLRSRQRLRVHACGRSGWLRDGRDGGSSSASQA